MAQGVPGRLRPRIFLTFRHYKGGRSSAKRTGRLYPRRNPWYSLSEAESTSGHMVLSGVPRKKSPVTQPGIDPGTVRLVAQCIYHYATPGPFYNIYWRLRTRCIQRNIIALCQNHFSFLITVFLRRICVNFYSFKPSTTEWPLSMYYFLFNFKMLPVSFRCLGIPALPFRDFYLFSVPCKTSPSARCISVVNLLNK